MDGIGASIIVRDLNKVARAIAKEPKRQKKALNTALKRQGFLLMKELKEQVRRGSPGGRKFKSLSFIARRYAGKGKRLKPNKPLRKLAIAVRYYVEKKEPYTVAVGWVGPKTSKSWKRIARLHQEGFSRPVKDWQRRYFAQLGEAMSEKSKARKYLFLRKSTTRLKTPERPILDPFWKAEKAPAWRMIKRNYKKKLKGQWI